MGVTVDSDAAMRMLTNVANAMGRKGLTRLRGTATQQMNAGIREAFSRNVDPSTGRAWKRRKVDPGWPPLWRTGTLMRNVYGASTVRGQRLFIKGQVHQMGSGNGSLHAQANSLFFGRKKGKRGGSMPGRRFAGISSRGAKTVKRAFERIIHKAAT